MRSPFKFRSDIGSEVALLVVGGEVALLLDGTRALAACADVHQGLAYFPGLREVRKVRVGDCGSSALASLRKIEEMMWSRDE